MFRKVPTKLLNQSTATPLINSAIKFSQGR